MSEQQLRAELDAVYRSTSWRITAPFRLLVSLMKQPRTILGLPRRILRKVASIGASPTIGDQSVAVQENVLDAQATTQIERTEDMQRRDGRSLLSPSAREIFRQLKNNQQK